MTEKKTCPYPGVFRYTWPGQNEAFACAIHANALENVSKAMGFHLQMVPILALSEAGITCQSADDIPADVKEANPLQEDN